MPTFHKDVYESRNQDYDRTLGRHRLHKTITVLMLLFYFAHVPSGKAAQETDWSVKVVDSSMDRMNPDEFGTWHYSEGFTLYGFYRVWQRTKESTYIQYIKDWVDLYVDEDGKLDRKFSWMDHTQPGIVLLYLYEIYPEKKYKIAAKTIREVYDDWPTTADGAFWHAKSKTGQLWADGVYMSLPFLIKYGSMFDDSNYGNNETADQLIKYALHLQDSSTGLLYHAYDEDGSSDWARRENRNRSPHFWGRAMGWYGMATIEVLELLPTDHPKRDQLIRILQKLVQGWATYQHSATGLWYQIVDKGDRSDNWHETSCSAMYTYVIARAVKRGYVDASYHDTAVKGFNGVLTKISLNQDGRTDLRGISEGTGVSDDYDYYINRNQRTNEFHGLGAFLLMFEEFQGTTDLTPPRPPSNLRIK